ncbi:uncharacterized protein LOC101735769 isoform X2 [Bombyx mori]|nr:uncharacterized protein LOC101735769 isoform X2 [Bombyx mori]XP_021208533.1 uncharacterized protein LOC101735769 isoform X2 [Bombyx mori]
MTYSREHNSIDRFKSSPSIKTFQSDRVLRSFSRPNYRIFNMNNTVIGIIKGENAKATRINIVSQDGRHPKFNLTAVLKSTSDPSMDSNSQMMPFYSNMRSLQPGKMKRANSISVLSGQRTPLSPTVNITSRDGKMSRLNALVQKSLTQKSEKGYRYTEMSLVKRSDNMKIEQLSLNCDEVQTAENFYDIDALLENSASQSELTNIEYYQKITTESNDNFCTEMHKGLPRITEVFSKFNSDQQKNLMQPIYVQVSEDSERTTSPTYTSVVSQSGISLLENLYNFKNQFITNHPLNPVHSVTAKTQCVFSTPTITTPSQHPTIAGYKEFSASYDRDNAYQNILEPRMQERDNATSFAGTNFDCNEVLSSSASSIETLSCQDIGANASIPEMVEDALELISQDGDYMERIGMNDKMFCMLCSWAGPKFMLEHHIEKEHSSEIHKRDSGEWNVTFTLGGVARRRAWSCRVVRHRAALYVLSARYRDPDCFMATLHTLSTDETATKIARMTIYNKVTGEPYSWEGAVPQLGEGMPYVNDTTCLKLSLAEMNLFPNSANLRLINRELVVKSPAKVVVGQPELNDIHIIVFVKIMP